MGTNINRNWDIHWNQNGSSSDPCDEKFAGPNPFSTISAHIFSNVIYTLKDQIKLFIALFGNGPAIDIPYGYTKALPKNYKHLLEKGQIAAKAMAQTTGTVYKVGNTANIYQPISGQSVSINNYHLLYIIFKCIFHVIG